MAVSGWGYGYTQNTNTLFKLYNILCMYIKHGKFMMKQSIGGISVEFSICIRVRIKVCTCNSATLCEYIQCPPKICFKLSTLVAAFTQ